MQTSHLPSVSWSTRVLGRFCLPLERVWNTICHPRAAFDEWVVDFLSRRGFTNINRHIVYGPPERLHLGNLRPKNGTFFNTRSGHIYIGKGTVFGYDCMFLTGMHVFEDGKLKQPKAEQVQLEGYDIRIGRGCWIASGAIIIGGVSLGDDCIVAAGAVVTKSFSSGTVIGGVPGKDIGRTADLPRRKPLSPEGDNGEQSESIRNDEH